MNKDGAVVAKMDFDVNAVMEIDDACERVLVQVADAIRGDAIQKQVIPFDVGTLQRAGEVYYQQGDAAAYIEHDTPYARRIYFGDNFNFQTVNNANAQARWYKDYESGGNEQDFVLNAYSELVKREAARYIE